MEPSPSVPAPAPLSSMAPDEGPPPIHRLGPDGSTCAPPKAFAPTVKVMPTLSLPAGYHGKSSALQCTFDTGAGPNAMSVQDALARGATILPTEGTAHASSVILADGSRATPKYWCTLPVLVAPGESIELSWILLPSMTGALIGSRALFGYSGIIDFAAGIIRMTVSNKHIELPFVYGVGAHPFESTPVLLASEDIVLTPNMLRDVNVHLSVAHQAGFHNQMLEFSTPADVGNVC